MNDQTQQVEQDIREALASGQDIYQKVRDITLKALTEHELDGENIKRVLEAVSNGVREGLNAQGQRTQQLFQQSAEALDDALVSTAEATKLAVEEASSKVHDFSEHDLKNARGALKSLEELFLETLSDIARNSGDVISDVVLDFIEHAKNNGTAVGRRTQVLLDTMVDLKELGEHTVISTTVGTASNLAKIGSGILAGIADSLKSDQKK